MAVHVFIAQSLPPWGEMDIPHGTLPRPLGYMGTKKAKKNFTSAGTQWDF